jgi:DNA-binding cell septation regulator SpoVG
MTEQSSKSTYYYKLFRVKRNDGRVTTVSMDPILVTKACQVMGGLRSVGKLVRESALTYNDGMHKNCSGFVSLQLRESVQRAVTERIATAKANAEAIAA